MSDTNNESMCSTCPLLDLNESMRRIVDIQHSSGLSQRQFVVEGVQNGIHPAKVAEDLYIEYRAYPEQIDALIPCIGRRAMAVDCPYPNEQLE